MLFLPFLKGCGTINGTNNSFKYFLAGDKFKLSYPILYIFSSSFFIFKFNVLWFTELFLNPENSEYGPNYESGQIRIAFLAGNEKYNKNLQGGVILGSKPLARKFGMKTTSNQASWSNEYHKFIYFYMVCWK